MFDCLVVGVNDDRFGQKVVAVVSIEEEIEAEDLTEQTRKYIAGYKLPKEILFVDKVERAPNGKANYKWAKEVANQAFWIEISSKTNLFSLTGKIKMIFITQ